MSRPDVTWTDLTCQARPREVLQPTAAAGHCRGGARRVAGARRAAGGSAAARVAAFFEDEVLLPIDSLTLQQPQVQIEG